MKTTSQDIMKPNLQHIQTLLNLCRNDQPDYQEELASAQLALNQIALERRNNLIGFREALLSLELAHAENIRNGHTPAIIGWVKERIATLSA